MAINRNKLYAIILFACTAGYLWLYCNETNQFGGAVDVCLVKHITQLPCPSCGTTSSVMSLLNGKFQSALQLNPFGYLIAIIMLATPIWIVLDFLMKKSSFFRCYLIIEAQLKKPKYAIPAIMLVVLNWIWNISKSL